MKKRIESFIKKNNIYVLSFFIPVVIMFITFIARGIFPFGDESFLHVDMYHQYYPFLKEFCQIIKDGESLLYSWNTGIGSNFLGLIVYYLASPFNLLALLIPENLLIEYMSYLVIIKIGLSGFTFSYYLSKHFNTKNFTIVFFAIAYSMSGYFCAYNWNVMWLDCLVLAPVIILGLERLVNEGKCALYCVTLGLCIFTNYYLSIMICIYLVLYFLVLLVSAKEKIKACLRFFVYSLLAGGMAAVLLIPELEMLMTSEFSSASFPANPKIYFNLLECFTRHFVAVDIEIGLEHWPNIYCGVAILILLPLYILCKEIKLKEKISKLVLLAFVFISFGVNTLNFIWHGMNYPNSLPARQSFLYIILLLTMCYEALQHIKDYSNKKLLIAYVLPVILFVAAIFINKDDAFAIYVYPITAVALIFYGIAIILYRNEKVKNINFFALIVLCGVVLETSTNLQITSVPTVTRSKYISSYEKYEDTLSSLMLKDQSFYRIEKAKRLTQNDAMLASYPSATLFSSTANSLINQFYERYGMQSSKVYYAYKGATPLTAALLNVKYIMAENELKNDPLYKQINQDENVILYENTAHLNFGYMVPLDIDYNETLNEDVLKKAMSSNNKALNPIEEQNALALKMGASGNIFEEFEIQEENANSTIIVPRDGYVYTYINNNSVKTLKTTDDLGNSNEFTKLGNHYIVGLGWHKKGTQIKLHSDDATGRLMADTYMFNDSMFNRLINNLNDESMENVEYTSTTINGDIKVKEDGILVLSIPYEKGWSLLIDGKPATPIVYENAFISVALDKGNHHISLEYDSQSLKLGGLISIISIVIFLLTIYLPKRNKN